MVGKGKAVVPSSKTAVLVRDMDCILGRYYVIYNMLSVLMLLFLVPTHHVGKIPGIYCGQTWAIRSLVQDWGVHR